MRRAWFLVEFTKAVERPEGVDGADPLTKRTFAEALTAFLFLPSTISRWAVCRQNRLSLSSALTSLQWVGLGQGLDFGLRGALPDHAVDAAVLPVAVRVDVGVAAPLRAA